MACLSPSVSRQLGGYWIRGSCSLYHSMGSSASFWGAVKSLKPFHTIFRHWNCPCQDDVPLTISGRAEAQSRRTSSPCLEERKESLEGESWWSWPLSKSLTLWLPETLMSRSEIILARSFFPVDACAGQRSILWVSFLRSYSFWLFEPRGFVSLFVCLLAYF